MFHQITELYFKILVYNGTNENGIQVGSLSGYGCQCEEFETKISLKYDIKSRSLSFYKNDFEKFEQSNHSCDVDKKVFGI